MKTNKVKDKDYQTVAFDVMEVSYRKVMYNKENYEKSIYPDMLKNLAEYIEFQPKLNTVFKGLKS